MQCAQAAVSTTESGAATGPQATATAPAAAAGSLSATAAAVDGDDDITAACDQDDSESAAAQAVTLILSHPTKASKPAGQLHLKVCGLAAL